MATINPVLLLLVVAGASYAMLVYISKRHIRWLVPRLLARLAYMESGELAYEDELRTRLAEFAPPSNGLEISRAGSER